VSACASSPIAVIADRVAPTLDRGRPIGLTDRLVDGSDGSDWSDGIATDDLLVVLARIPDPRARRGRRHRLVSVLAAAVCAVLAGACSYVAIAEWVHDLPISVRVRLGLGRCRPSESTIRRILQAIDPDLLDQALCGWLVRHPAASSPPLSRAQAPGRRTVAVDGKTARGSRTCDAPGAHLFAAFDHTSGIVLGQTQVADPDKVGKGSEIAAFAPLLDRLELTDVIVTADALHTQNAHAIYLRERG
jgi:DDE_Tnp_1-associated